MILDNDKAVRVNPFYDGIYEPPHYIKPGVVVSCQIDSREMELAILAAYDYGIDALSEEGKRCLDRLIATLKLEITGS